MAERSQSPLTRIGADVCEVIIGRTISGTEAVKFPWSATQVVMVDAALSSEQWEKMETRRPQTEKAIS
ncbi:hypothetical protein FHT28_003602 [Rhizobium sp. SG570]|nr:hypothetical protein [Rhizobium sp. SG570]